MCQAVEYKLEIRLFSRNIVTLTSGAIYKYVPYYTIQNKKSLENSRWSDRNRSLEILVDCVTVPKELFFY